MNSDRARYIEILLAKLERKQKADPALCDRIERLLGLQEPKSRVVRPTLTSKDIINVVAERWNVTPGAILGLSREQPVATARQVAMRLTRELTGKTVTQVGEIFHRNHATVIHACEVTEAMALGDIRNELAQRFATEQS